MKNSLVQRIRKTNPSKASSRSNNSSVSKDLELSRSVRKGEERQTTKHPFVDDNMMHIITNNNNQKNNKINLNTNKEDSENIGLNDNKSHRQSAGSNNSNFYSNKLRNVRKAVSILNKDLDRNILDTKGRKDTHQPLKQGAGNQNQPLLNNIQNKNVLTLTQNLLQKRNRAEQ